MADITIGTKYINYDTGPSWAMLMQASPQQTAAVVKKGTAANECAQTSGDNQVAIGVVNHGAPHPDGTVPAAGDYVTVYGPGNIVWCKAGGSITAFTYVMSAASGEVKTIAQTPGTIDNIVGMAMAAADDNDWIPVLVTLGQSNRAVT